jgi:glycerate 2-kinase
VKPPACVITGGETTVTVRGKGLGGRNQEFALAGAQSNIAGLTRYRDPERRHRWHRWTHRRSRRHCRWNHGRARRSAGPERRAFLANNDSYHFFEALGDLIKTGPTGTNVADIH